MADWPAILAEHGPRVWRTAFRVLNHAADAQDCYQDTFLAAWRLAEPVHDWGRVLTCLATRKAIDRLRVRVRVRAAARTGPLAAAPEPGAYADPSENLRTAELLDRLRAGLAGLPGKQAEVVWLGCVEELSPADIAHQMSLPPGEVRVLLHRGRKRLRELFSAVAPETP